MKSLYLLTAALILVTNLLHAQSGLYNKVNNGNYYNYLSNGKNLKGQVTMNWLRTNDAIPIIKDEMEKAGFESLQVNYLYKAGTGQNIKISVYSTKSNFGFVYIEGHKATPEISDRKNFSLLLLPSLNIAKLPENTFPLAENVYWYQYTDDKIDDRRLITKAIAEKILRQDIQKYLIDKGLKTRFNK